eukprot:CAMPEP_0174834194 /NCGR_PEP_ID=MMETSP1114-20130205/4681_1 /TAXON_ID=312471 /ORGANISM="Neobodo designis, Strain CCAP 1951/1" /LENGTH=149 /DNA_ID=CAMNT_0016068099 /DNA_START=328 /DNA_END=775 /DNA_ORIENTATION=-
MASNRALLNGILLKPPLMDTNVRDASVSGAPASDFPASEHNASSATPYWELFETRAEMRVVESTGDHSSSFGRVTNEHVSPLHNVLYSRPVRAAAQVFALGLPSALRASPVAMGPTQRHRFPPYVNHRPPLALTRRCSSTTPGEGPGTG